jgi:polar amino acid transport system substrate-binding protein
MHGLLRRFLWLLLLFGLPAIAAEPPARTTLTLSNCEWPPYTSSSLPGQGRISELVRAAFAKEGIDVRYEFLPWKRALEEARNGEYDGSIVWAHTPDREADFVFSDAVVTTDYVLFFARSRPIHWKSLYDLRGLTIGGVLGATPTGEYADLAAAGVFKREVARSDELNLRKAAAGHLDAAGVEREVGNYLLSTTAKDIADQIDFDPKPIVRVSNYLMLSKKTPHAEELIRRFNRGLAAVQAHGKS